MDRRVLGGADPNPGTLVNETLDELSERGFIG